MSSKELKDKIQKSLEGMDESHLQSVYYILKEIKNQQQFGNLVSGNLMDTKIAKGIEQLDKGEGSDFNLFLKEIKLKYGRKE